MNRHCSKELKPFIIKCERKTNTDYFAMILKLLQITKDLCQKGIIEKNFILLIIFCENIQFKTMSFVKQPLDECARCQSGWTHVP